MVTADVAGYSERQRVSRLCAGGSTLPVRTVSGVSNGQLQRSLEHCKMYFKTDNVSVDEICRNATRLF